jgi:hypothetical protein
MFLVTYYQGSGISVLRDTDIVVISVAYLATSKRSGVIVAGKSARNLVETPTAVVRVVRPPRKTLKRIFI